MGCFIINLSHDVLLLVFLHILPAANKNPMPTLIVTSVDLAAFKVHLVLHPKLLCVLFQAFGCPQFLELLYFLVILPNMSGLGLS
jgi:hypothetical protein